MSPLQSLWQNALDNSECGMLSRWSRSPSFRIIGKRVLQTIPVLIGVTLITFCLLNLLPGGTCLSILGFGATTQHDPCLRYSPRSRSSFLRPLLELGVRCPPRQLRRIAHEWPAREPDPEASFPGHA